VFRNLRRRLTRGHESSRDRGLNVYGVTDTGKVRGHNEDSILALGGEQSPPGVDALLVVADGMGGHAAGEVASGMAVSHIAERFGPGEFASVAVDGLEDALRTLLQDVNSSVHSAGQDSDKHGMGTTCTLVVIKDKQLHYAHVGDSRAYLFRDGELTQITSDHSWVEEMVSLGSLTREQARVHPNRNVITRAIGLDIEVQVDTGTQALRDGDLVLLCSDGLNSMIDDEEIAGILDYSSSDDALAALIKAANDAGGHDNTSVVIGAYGQRDSRMDEITTQPITQETIKRGSDRPVLKRIWHIIFKLT